VRWAWGMGTSCTVAWTTNLMLRTLVSRLPQALRAMIRVCIPVVIPVFVGPFWWEALQWQ
jgi:TRAP-type C4-dicarboxylate transport system permease small subunit